MALPDIIALVTNAHDPEDFALRLSHMVIPGTDRADHWTDFSRCLAASFLLFVATDPMFDKGERTGDTLATLVKSEDTFQQALVAMRLSKQSLLVYVGGKMLTEQFHHGEIFYAKTTNRDIAAVEHIVRSGLLTTLCWWDHCAQDCKRGFVLSAEHSTEPQAPDCRMIGNATDPSTL